MIHIQQLYLQYGLSHHSDWFWNEALCKDHCLSLCQVLKEAYKQVLVTATGVFNAYYRTRHHNLCKWLHELIHFYSVQWLEEPPAGYYRQKHRAQKLCLYILPNNKHPPHCYCTCPIVVQLSSYAYHSQCHNTSLQGLLKHQSRCLQCWFSLVGMLHFHLRGVDVLQSTVHITAHHTWVSQHYFFPQHYSSIPLFPPPS